MSSLVEQRAYRIAFKLADEAGMKAVEDVELQMIQAIPVNLMTDEPIGLASPPFPICGFAWVNFRPATTRFVRWLKKQGIARKAYVGGANMHVSKFGQSYDCKRAYAQAFAQVIKRELVETGLEPALKVYAGSRLD